MEHVFILKVGVSLWRREQLDNFCGPVSSLRLNIKYNDLRVSSLVLSHV